MVLNSALIFCTTHPSMKKRTGEWYEYHAELFRGEPIHFVAVNDGPEALGRRSLWCVPGWKRSFWAGVHFGRNYRNLAHVESDCFITARGRAKFLDALYSPGYRVGFSEVYGMIETAIQVLNDDGARGWFANRYAGRAAWYEELNFEGLVNTHLRPEATFVGERLEEFPERFQPAFDYAAQTDRATLQGLQR